MTDIQISVTDERTIVVKADTKRFGKHAIMFEGHTFMECCDYIRRATGKEHFKLQSLYGIPTFTDTEGRTMPCILDVIFA